MNLNILKALADPSRLALMDILDKGELCVCVLPGIVKKTQSTVSIHLKVLHEAGLLSMRKDGSKRLYSLSTLGKRIVKQVKGW